MKLCEISCQKTEHSSGYRVAEMAIVYKRILGLSDRGQGHSMIQWPVDPPADFAWTSGDGRRLGSWE
ncbi:MAG: hypothetical protein IPN90_06045 [Elusimicrobia bacterium]|nr:hypothetical protein [Elusimicrobiota bacterium]